MYFLGIDVGTGGTRALIVNEKGLVIASATEEHEAFASPEIGWAEQNPEDWWRACGQAVQTALAGANLNGDQVDCVGFSGQMHGAVIHMVIHSLPCFAGAMALCCMISREVHQ